MIDSFLSKIRRMFPGQKEFVGQRFDPNANYVEGVPQPGQLADLVEAYKLHPWVYAAVYCIASNFAQINFSIYKKQIGAEDIEDKTHPFNRLLENPNPYLSDYELREIIAISLEMFGNAFLAIEKSKKGVPIEIYPLPANMVRVVSSKEKQIDHFVYEVNGKRILFEYDSMIHLKYTNPINSVYGQPSAEAVRTEIVADLYAADWNKNFFKNSGRPDAILETDKNLDEGTKKRIMSAWRQMHSGIKNSHKMAILEGGLKYKEGQRSQKDMDFILQRKAARETILAAFGVPPGMVGVLEYANYANMEAQKKTFWMETMLPKIRRFEAAMSMRLRDITFLPNHYLAANLSWVKALQPDFLLLSQIALNFKQVGYPVNQITKALELPFEEIDGGDESNLQLNTDVPQDVPDTQNQKQLKNKSYKFSDIEKEIMWKEFDNALTLHQDKMKMTVRSYFRGQKNRVQKNFEENSRKILVGKISDEKKNIKQEADRATVEISLLFDEAKEIEMMKDVVGRDLKSTFFDFANMSGRRVSPGFSFNLNDPVALEWINGKRFKIARDANRYTKETIQQEVINAIEDAVKQGFNEDETIREITARIDDIYEFALKGRSERIARTEVLSASNSGGLAGIKAGGATKKEWLSSRDSLVRETHQVADGQIVKIDEEFIVGQTRMEFPGDPKSRVEEIVNCRCTILPVIENV